jgi:DNA-binding response OmpR family regulator
MKILIIEDDAEIIEFVSIALDISWPASEMISTHQGNAGVQLVETAAPDVVLLDLGLPDIDGLDVLKQIRAFSEVPVIIISVRADEPTVVKGLEWGADEYIVKPFGQLELLARIRAVLRRSTPEITTDSIYIGPVKLNTVSRELSCRKKSAQLTRTESLIVHTLMTHIGQIVTYPRLAEAIWGDEYPNASDAIRVYIRRIRTKLEAVIDHDWSLNSKPGIGYVLEIAK